MSSRQNASWEFLGSGNVLGIPTNIFVLLIAVLIAHVFMTRSRYGWHFTAIGGGRRAARHAGIALERTVFSTYVLSGTLSALGAVFYAARLQSATADTAQNWEVLALTAVVLGGCSIAGGRGTVGRAMIGTTIVMVLINGLLRFGVLGSVSSFFLGVILLFAVGLDVKWVKNLSKAIQKIYVVPTYLEFPKIYDITRPASGTPWEVNSRLEEAEVIGLDRQGRLYCCNRPGYIARFSGENFGKREIFARTGGRPLGMAFDKDENLIVCVAGMGLYGVRPKGEVYKLTDKTNRTWWKVNDDSRLRIADDLDIAPDGKIYFSELTIRYETEEWVIDSLEGRGNGRVVCYDPVTDRTRTIIRNMVSPNGICVSHNGQSILIAQTWLSRVMRYWITGHKKGKLELFVGNLPGIPDNINRASGGDYWLGIVGMRTPTYDLAMRMPSFQRRMVKRVPPDEWLFCNMNTGCVIKLNEKGEVLESLWDISGKSHPSVSSMREDRGYLYLGGLHADHIGRIKIEGVDPNWNGPESYWGKR